MTLSEVKRLYTDWPYPKPITDIEEFNSRFSFPGCPSRDQGFYSAFPQHERFDPTLLVIGCGTHQAAVMAFNNPDSQVTGVDFSSRSLDHANGLKKKYALDNLELIEADLLDLKVPAIGYDLVFATGVLHHLTDPVEGFRAIKRQLSSRGVVCAMVYGPTLRQGVYWLQEAFKMLDADMNDRVALMEAMEFVTALPDQHPVHAYTRVTDELQSPEAIADTFFHPVDTSFTVNEIFRVTKEAELTFRGFQDNLPYYWGAVCPQAFNRSANYRNKISGLSFYRQAAVVELLGMHLGRHTFYAGNQPVLDLDKLEELPAESIAEVVPKLIGIRCRGKVASGLSEFEILNGPKFQGSKIMAYVVDAFDGSKTVQEVANAFLSQSEGPELSYPDSLRDVCRCLKALWTMGRVVLVR